MWHTYVVMNVFRCPSLTCFRLQMASRLSVSDVQSLSGKESNRQIKVELQCFMWRHYCSQTNRDGPQKTEWSTLLSMMQHSSVSSLWIWVIFFPRTLECMQNSSGLFSALCVILCTAYSNNFSQNSCTCTLTYNLYLQPISKLCSLNIWLFCSNKKRHTWRMQLLSK